MKKKSLAICWANESDKVFLENSFNDEWNLTYVNNFESLDLEMNLGRVNLALVKLEKGNVNDIINSKIRLQLLKRAYGVPIGFIVKYENPFVDSNYQLLVVDDTEIMTINMKNIKRVLNQVISGTNNYSGWDDERSQHLDGRSYNYAI
ncbi:MAG: hypothetical protein JW995_15640 [Melioribacteraceae bacterium]|nr:hypothetical protein [Melioribacteraceae bacterium]